LLRDIKKIFNISLVIRDKTPLIKVRNKEFSLNNFLITVRTKFKSYFVDIFEHAAHPITRIYLYYKFVDILDSSNRSSKIKLKKLIKEGKYVSGYVPYKREQLLLLIYNFYSTNYGIRSAGNILIGLVDEFFNPCDSLMLDISYRQILAINPEDYFKKSYKTEPKFCVLLQINNRIEPDHGKSKYNKKGGHLRFFGIYNQFSAYNHCMFMPHPFIFARKITNILYPLKFLERMIYTKSKVINNIEHIAPFHVFNSNDISGDMSGKIKSLPGYTINKNKKDLINSIFHTTHSFSRDERQTPFFNWISHVVGLPPIKDLDVELFFGECCSDNSEFQVQLVEIKDEKSFLVEIIKEEIIKVDCSTSTSLSQIFTNFETPKNGGWVVFKPISGRHSDKYINMFYKTKDNRKLFDGVHSHNFHSNNGRTLKFAPFPLKRINSTDKNLSESLAKFKIHLMIMGHIKKDINARIRLYSSKNINHEEIIQIKIPKNQILIVNDFHQNFVGKSDVRFSKSIKDIDYGICQIESEETNLQANLYVAKYEREELKSIAVDHFTGG